ncbi:MAG TPA: PaaX family transcriptional regulator C-terminal domain-containing protein [Acidimicrobiales bacterium]|nr:PaaX family transcriptional regulator C-terminal domain-containing protein [Acidimicrobiales bacterium]
MATSTSSSVRDASAPQLVTAMFLAYWFGSPQFVPSALLVALLGTLGVAEPAARAALSRLARRGQLEGSRSGRHTAYRLAPASFAAARAQGWRMMRFGTPRAWDHRWTCVVFSIPEAERGRRPALRQRLRDLRLGPLFDGFWITPLAPLEAIDRSLRDLHVRDVAVFRVDEVPRAGGVDLLSAWDLPALRAGYDDLVTRLEPVVRSARAGTLAAHEALVSRVDVCNRWRALAAADPGLPPELLPADWPQRRARQLFVEAYDTLGPLGAQHVRRLASTAARGRPTPVPRSRRVADCVGPVALGA